jgi:hypothetical protein
VELAFSPSQGLKGKIFFYWFLHRKLIETPDSSKKSKQGAAGASDWDNVHLQQFSAKTTFESAL